MIAILLYRLLVAGGAKIMKCQPPYRETLKTKITHVLTTKESAPDLIMLHRSGFQDIWCPEYIADYLLMHVSVLLAKCIYILR